MIFKNGRELSCRFYVKRILGGMKKTLLHIPAEVSCFLYAYFGFLLYSTDIM